MSFSGWGRVILSGTIVLLVLMPMINLSSTVYASSWSIKKYIKEYDVKNWEEPTEDKQLSLSTEKGYQMDNVKATIPSDNKMIIYTGIAVAKYVKRDKIQW